MRTFLSATHQILRHLFFIAWIIMAQSTGIGQTIQFSVHVASSLDATKDQDMTFETVYAGSGLTQINLGDAGMGVFAITGNEELDVIVDMSAPSNLTNTGSSSDVIPFTMQFAYANRGVNDINQAVVVSGTTARFQLRQRESGPAGTPPTPPSAHHTPAQATAYLYIYGSMNVGLISPGAYTGNVDLTVTYD
ncbi:MAG: hypothetical protein K9N35_10215 [Candidatus Marinimicrobia bacterium]|nr:hypothetical protein [Candidatus Neomarinimicrobiota bacterium]